MNHWFAPGYAGVVGQHIAPVRKFGMIHEALRAGGLVAPDAWRESVAATRAELETVHSAAFLDRVEALAATPEAAMAEFEIPISPPILDLFRLMTGGTIGAARDALRDGAAVNLGGGFHHGFADRGEGFCLYNDLAIAIRVLRAEGLVKRAAVIDLDVHQGNGTARIFRDDPDTFTLSIHQEHNYPVKEKSSLDLGLDDHTDDEGYQDALRSVLPAVFDGFRPDLVLYQAGVDPFRDDQLGGLALTHDGLVRRDRLVARTCRHYRVPVALTLGGGYAFRIEDVVTAHLNTIRVFRETFIPDGPNP